MHRETKGNIQERDEGHRPLKRLSLTKQGIKERDSVE